MRVSATNRAERRVGPSGAWSVYLWRARKHRGVSAWFASQQRGPGGGRARGARWSTTARRWKVVFLWLVVTSFATSSFASDDWEAFKARCLDPLEQNRAIITNDLRELRHPDWNAAGFAVYPLAGSNGAVLVARQIDPNVQCGVTNAQISAGTMDAWIADAVDSGAYRSISQIVSDAPILLRSTTEHRNVIEIEIQPLGMSDGPWLFAKVVE